MDQFTGSGQRRRDRLLMSRQTFVCRRGTTKPPETYDRGHSQDRRGWPAWRFTQAPPASSGSGPRRESELGRLSMVPAMGPTGSHAAHQYLLEAFAGRAAEAGISIQDLRGRRYRDWQSQDWRAHPPSHVCRPAILTTGRRRYLLGSGHCQC
jgi:hypothetical protein